MLDSQEAIMKELLTIINIEKKKIPMEKRPRVVKDVRANSNVRAVTRDRLIGGLETGHLPVVGLLQQVRGLQTVKHSSPAYICSSFYSFLFFCVGKTESLGQ